MQYQGQRIGLVAHRIPIALIKVRYQGLDADVVRTLQLPNNLSSGLEAIAQETRFLASGVALH
jgi:hypothetical protein